MVSPDDWLSGPLLARASARWLRMCSMVFVTRWMLVAGLLFTAVACGVGPSDGEVAKPAGCELPSHRTVRMSSYLDEAVGTLNSPSASEFAFSLSVNVPAEGTRSADELVSRDVLDLLDRLAYLGRTTSLQRLDRDRVSLLIAFGSRANRDRAYCELAGDAQVISSNWIVEIVDVSTS